MAVGAIAGRMWLQRQHAILMRYTNNDCRHFFPAPIFGARDASS